MAVPATALDAPPRQTASVRSWIRRLHLWVGLSVGLLYALIALSGSVLVLQGPLLPIMHPQLTAHSLPNHAMRAAVLADIARDWRARGLRSADLPTTALPVWQLYFSDGSRRYLDPANGKLLLTRSPGSDLLLTLRDWHTHLVAGEAGEALLGILGWITLALLISGVWLWWPGRHKLRASLRTCTQPPARRWLSWHRSIGVISLPLLVLITLTGTLMVYSGGTRQALQTLFGDAPTVPAQDLVVPRAQEIDWSAVLDAAHRALPGAELRRITLPSAGNARVTIRARMPAEWHPVGRSQVGIDPYRAQVLSIVDATADGTGARVSNAIYPLHAGSVGGITGQLLVVLAGLLPPFFLITGFLYWRARRQRGRA
ncbi:MAG TPA: PepSY-associated TM helix domain-containing protein [Rhodanobacter sp.]